MGLIIFNRPKPKQFNLKPRYYNEHDENKARRERMSSRAEGQGEFNADDFRAEFRTRIERSRESNSTFNQNYSSVKRMMVLVSITAIIIYIMYFIGKKYLG